MIPWLLLILLLVGCTTKSQVVTESRVALSQPSPTVPKIVNEAVRVQDEAAHMAATREDLSSVDLLRMLELSRNMQRAVKRMKANQTPKNIAAARVAAHALLAFTNKKRTVNLIEGAKP